MECLLFQDEEEDARLKQLINELTNVGAKIKLFENELTKSKEVTIEYLMNRFDRYKDIQQRNQLLDDLMYDDGANV